MRYEDGLPLGEVIRQLEEIENKGAVLSLGFARPHSYRGYYECLAFEPTKGVSVADMLTAAKSAVGTTYDGWKGGEYSMGLNTECFWSFVGDCGVPMTESLLYLLLHDARPF
jgi:hypothetical protein